MSSERSDDACPDCGGRGFMSRDTPERTVSVACATCSPVVPLTEPTAGPSPENPGKVWYSGGRVSKPRPCVVDAGWPEFEVTLTFYVSSDDPGVIDLARIRTLEAIGDAAAEL